MKLYSLKIEGFRRHLDTEVLFSDATFLIGENNVGKSSVLDALNYLLNDVNKITDEEFYKILDNNGENKTLVNKITLTAEFRNLPIESKTWRGFKGRVLNYNIPDGSSETGLRIFYRKTFEPNKEYKVELKEYRKNKKTCYINCQTLNDFINNGIDISVIEEIFGSIDKNKKLSNSQLKKLEEIDEIYEFDESEEVWFQNPGGIPGNVLHRLPKFLLIPAKDKLDELSGNSGTLIKTLSELFDDVRDQSSNYKEAQKYLDLLAQELDPQDTSSEFGEMMEELNGILCDIFPDCGIHAKAQLSDADKVIKPQFTVSMSSNVETSVSLQGTGMIRSAVFALLRYRSIRDNKKSQKLNDSIRPLIIGFEEPEIYLHPNAANSMRDTIYELASSDMNQIVCTTHSPYMIDLSQKPSQILNNFFLAEVSHDFEGVNYQVEIIKALPFNTTHAFKKLHSNDKSYVKMLLKIDDYIARVFFAKNVLIVEGDTEDIVLRETISRMPEKVKKDVHQNWQIIKAHGKAVIISLVKYLQAMGIKPIVIHDEDSGNQKAESYNKPILNAIGDESRHNMLHNCLEEVLGYNPPSNEKPYTAYCFIKDNWTQEWTSITESWRLIIEQIFSNSFDLIKNEPSLANEIVAATKKD